MPSTTNILPVAKLSLLIATITLGSLNTNAAPVAVTGSINNWKSWNVTSQSSFAPYLYLVVKDGIDLVQGTSAGAPVSYASGQTVIYVTGIIDSVTGFGTLTQVGSFTGYFDVGSFGFDGYTDDWTANGGDGGALTFSGLAWTLDATGMHQTAGAAAGCEADSPKCYFLRESINVNDHSNGTYQSAFDFQGINAGFLTLPRSNADQTNYGAALYKTWVETPGLSGSWSGLTYNATVASRQDSGRVSTNMANMANLTLSATTVPVPAAAWLMGSGLIGLAGIARRKNK